MYVSTEVATAKHVYECLKAGIDILLGKCTLPQNPFAIAQEIADALKGVDIPGLGKEPRKSEYKMIGAMERINNAGLKRLGSNFTAVSATFTTNSPQPAQWRISHRTASPHSKPAHHL